ncbi:MAG: hypothetical protein M5U33_13910 [Pseudorhodoplanes sp.]|nr:hypothetical protein [Pseudorhodoplanes sp.]
MITVKARMAGCDAIAFLPWLSVNRLDRAANDRKRLVDGLDAVRAQVHAFKHPLLLANGREDANGHAASAVGNNSME